MIRAQTFHQSGHPVLRAAMTGLMKGLGADANIGGQAIMAYEEFQRWGQHNLEYGTPARKFITIAKPLAVVGLIAAGIALIVRAAANEQTGATGTSDKSVDKIP